MMFGGLIRIFEEWLNGHGGTLKPDPNLDPVLLVPGIGGTMLIAENKKAIKERVWVRLFEADSEFRSKLYSKFQPFTGKTVSLDPNIEIQVPEDRHGLYSCDILDPDVIIRLEAVYYFHDLITTMLGWGFEGGATLFGFGYDFRQSNRLMETLDRLKLKLQNIFKISGGKKVNIVTHSMGGLLLKSFLAVYPESFEKYVKSWIAIAAPFQGAPAFITDCLLTGVEFVKGWQAELFVSKWSTHQLLIECPSIYEMMDSEDYKWKERPQLKVWLKHEDQDSVAMIETANLIECISIMKAALEENVLSYHGTSVPLSFNEAINDWANETRRILKNARLPKGVKFYNIFGTSYATPFSTQYGSKEHPLNHLKDILHTEANFDYVDGDGTVPVESSVADNLEAELRIGVPGDHRGLLSEERVFRILKVWLGVGEPDPFYNLINDYVILPSRAEFEEFQKDHVLLHSKKPFSEHNYNCEFVTVAVETNQDGMTRAEAHSTIRKCDSFSGISDFECIEVNTIGVVEGTNTSNAALALEDVISLASQRAVDATISNH